MSPGLRSLKKKKKNLYPGHHTATSTGIFDQAQHGKDEFDREWEYLKTAAECDTCHPTAAAEDVTARTKDAKGDSYESLVCSIYVSLLFYDVF